MIDYFYPSTQTLVNRFGIKDANKLKEVETAISAERYDALSNGEPLNIEINETGLKALHKHLFRDVYDWAGDYRDTSMAKAEPLLNGESVDYPDPCPMIDGEPVMADEIKKAFQKIGGLKKGPRYVEELGDAITQLWVAHPFRDGNTRTTALFLEKLLEKQGYKLTESLNNKETGMTFRDSLVKASAGDSHALLETLAGCARPGFVMKSVAEYREAERLEKRL